MKILSEMIKILRASLVSNLPQCLIVPAEAEIPSSANSNQPVPQAGEETRASVSVIVIVALTMLC